VRYRACSIDQIIAFDRRGLSLTNSFSETFENISPILLKTRFVLSKFLFQTVWQGFTFNHFDVIGPKAAKFGKITQYNGHFAGQGHSRSHILVPIESPYMRSVLTYILSLTVSKLLQIIDQIYVFDTLVQGEPLNSRLRKLA